LSSAPNRRGLGRGLEVLLGGGEPIATELLELPIDAIHANPKQPRKRFDGEAGSGLAESVRRQGVIQPLLVRPRAAGGYEIVAGERRWRAARDAGHSTIPVVIREADDRDTLLLGLIENVAREQLTPVEEARAYAVLLDEFGLTLGEMAERVGRSKPSVSNRIRMLDLPDDVLGMLERGQLTEGHARAVLAVPDHEGRRRLAREIVQKGLSVRAAEQRAKWAGAKQKPRVKAAPVDPQLAARVRDALEQLTGFHAKVGRGFEVLIGGGAPELAQLPVDQIHPNPRQPRRHFDGESASGLAELPVDRSIRTRASRDASSTPTRGPALPTRCARRVSSSRCSCVRASPAATS